MTIGLTLTTGGLLDGTAINASDVLTPINEIDVLLENVLNGAQDAEALRFAELGATPGTPASGKWKIYTKSGGLYLLDDAGVETLVAGSVAATTETTEFLSGSTNGRAVKLAATATPGTLVHTAHATSQDVIWLYAQNSDTVTRKLTLEFGGTTSPDDTIEVSLPAKSGPMLIIPGLPLSNSLVVRAFAASANVITVSGYVTRGTSYQYLSATPGTGRNIKVAATATAGTLVHTAHATSKDRVWLWAQNSSANAVKLTIEFGGTTAPDDLIEITIPGESGFIQVVPGYYLSGSLAVRAFAASANVITIGGFVERT